MQNLGDGASPEGEGQERSAWDRAARSYAGRNGRPQRKECRSLPSNTLANCLGSAMPAEAPAAPAGGPAAAAPSAPSQGALSAPAQAPHPAPSPVEPPAAVPARPPAAPPAAAPARPTPACATRCASRSSLVGRPLLCLRGGLPVRHAASAAFHGASSVLAPASGLRVGSGAAATAAWRPFMDAAGGRQLSAPCGPSQPQVPASSEPPGTDSRPAELREAAMLWLEDGHELTHVQQEEVLRLVQIRHPGSWRAALHSSERVPLVLQRPLQHLARVVRQGAASLWPPVGLTPAQASPPAPGALAPQRFVTREATMHDVAPASAPLPQPLPQPERQRCAASAAGTGSGDVAMAAAPAQQLRLPRRSAPRDSAMADAPPLRLPPPRAGPARAPPAGHPAAQPDFAMAEAAALSQPQLPAPGRLGPAVRVRTTAATRPARLPQLMPPASPSGQLPLRAQALPVPPPAAPAPAPPVPAARTRAPHATGATALPAAQRQRPQRRPPGPLVLPPPPPLPPPPALPGPPRMRAPQRRRAPPGPSSPAATDSGSERALRPSSPVRHRRAGDTASRRNPPRQRALHGPWYSCTGRPSSGAPARP